MTVATPVLSPLSYDDKEVVRVALQEPDWKIYATASVFLSLRIESSTSPILDRRGALVLSRRTSDRRRCVQLIDLDAVPGEVIWQYELSPEANLNEDKEAEKNRRYALHDGALKAICIFADGVQATKFAEKFMRTARRDSESRLSHKMEKLQLNETGFHGRAIRREKREQVPIEQTDIYDEVSDSSSSDTLRPSSVGRDERPSSAVSALDAFGDAPDQDSSGKGHWICDINGISCEIPDLTAKLSHLEEDGPPARPLRGGFGVVRRVHLKDGRRVALKTIFLITGKPDDKMKDRKRFRNEVAMQYMHVHPNILPVLGIAEPKMFNLGASLILPWMKNSDSFKYVCMNPEVKRLPLIHGIINGIAFLHSKGVIHGDIKGGNILISDDGTPMLSDFGLSASSTSIDEQTHELSTSLQTAGSVSWMAIELINSKSPALAVSKHSDMWAFAMTVIELLTGKNPFHGYYHWTTWSIIKNHEYANFPKRPETNECTDKLWGLVTSCWAVDPKTRPTADKALLIVGSIASAGTGC